MASLDAALSRLAIALDALETRLPNALAGSRVAEDTSEEVAKLQAERSAMQDEIDALKAEVRALDDLHEDISAKLDLALRDVQAVIAE
jgi:predicted  nucleic acid-binding Zn-ribbon protein